MQSDLSPQAGRGEPNSNCGRKSGVAPSSPSPRPYGEKVGMRGRLHEFDSRRVPLTRIASSMQSDLSPQAGRGEPNSIGEKKKASPVLLPQDRARSMIRKSGYRFSLATSAKRLRGDHAQNKKMKRDDE